MQNSGSVSNRIFVACFMLALCVPVLHINRAEKSDTENRNLAVMPHLIDNGKINNKFGEEFNAWFNDRFFGRTTLMRIHNNFVNTVKITDDGGNNNQRVLIGRDNWLFFKADDSIKNFTNSRVPSDDEMAAGLQYLQDIDAWCKKHNKKFYYVIAPDKSKIYPEFYPTGINKVKPDTFGMGMTFYRYIKSHSDIDVLYPYQELMRAKTSGDLLYYNNDTHWNMRGSYVVFRILYQKIYNKEFDEDKYIRGWVENQYKGDLVKMLDLRDSSKYMQEKFKEPEFLQDAECEKIKMYSSHKGLIHCTKPGEKLRAFVLRDSFATALQPYLAQVFGSLDLHWKHNIEKSNLDAIEHDYDIVILENVERNIPSILKQKFPKD